MAERATFNPASGLELECMTDQELGHGSYATACTRTKVHGTDSEMCGQEDPRSATACRFQKECRLVSQVCHPNTVQFLEVYFQQGVQAPILVMESLPTNLTSGLHWAIRHSPKGDQLLDPSWRGSAWACITSTIKLPPIIHRDLASNNVLLTPDLGVVRILNLTPLDL
jgi:serine/threonine protein kinase